MFAKKMPGHTAIGRQLKRWLKFGRFMALGAVLSVAISALSLTSSAQAQLIPNRATIQYDVPGSVTNPAGNPGVNPARADLPSNTVLYPTGAVLGTNTLGLNLVKSADKSAAEPGDVVVYRLLLQNRSAIAADNLQIVDTLPLGVNYVLNSATGVPDAPISEVVSGRTLTLQFPSLPAGGTLTVTYAAVLTPDAIRGTGRNVAVASANLLPSVQSEFRLTIRQGILSDCGTIIGRVFVDKNFDGEQQPGEPGVPNAVIYMESGNRIITDPDGLFSVANAVSGHRVGTLDISSLPGYTLAPNLYRVEANSQSRLVGLMPGGLARMNFAVTPAFGEGEG